MIIQCQSCAAKYFLSEEKVPANPLKVRCPKCKAVFMLAPRSERVPVGAGVAAAAPAPAAVPLDIETTASPRKKAAAAVPLDVTEDSPARAQAAAPAPAPAAPAKSGRGGKGEDRAKRLARVLVSDILYYNRERRDQALREGNLMTALSEEIKKSWELYKEKVGPEAAQSTSYFKEALNEILADGQEVF
ncbi:MAG TPA: zinc-ribbon domain-containing protein [Candidatus Krumholzibacteria bacterium]|nr:zinc-ribbon domain-containing protein [Candidatus Krumholzibacteria bacterium]